MYTRGMAQLTTAVSTNCDTACSACRLLKVRSCSLARTLYCSTFSEANYRAAIWRHSLVPRPNVPSPDGCGWKLEDSALRVHWMNQEPAPTELLELVPCGCKTSCLSRRCSYAKASLPCTSACSCVNCKNCQPEEADQLEPEISLEIDGDHDDSDDSIAEDD